MKKQLLIALVVFLLIGFGAMGLGLTSVAAATKSSAGTLDNGLWMNLNTQNCANLTTKIAETIRNYESNRASYFATYAQKRIEIEKWLHKLAASGYDIKQLRSDLIQWNIRIVSMAHSYDKYITDLRRTQTSSCGNSHGQFVRSLNQARLQYQDFQKKVKEVKRFFNAVIIPDLIALNSQVRDKFPIKEMR